MMFVNYFRSLTRETPTNIVAARTVLGFYVIWKTVRYDWELFVQTPFSLAGGAYTVLIPYRYPFLLTLEKWLLIFVMLSFIVGYRLLSSSFLGAVLLGHLATVRFTLNPAGGTTALFIAVWFLVFFGLFHEQSNFGVDSIRGGSDSLASANGFLQSTTGSFRMDALRWSLLSIALTYFGAGFLKVVHGPLLEWATVENLSRTITMMNAKNDVVSGIGPYLVQYPSVVFLAAVATVVLELGFILAVLAGISITPFVLGFYTMHLVIALTMGPFFFDIYLLFLVFLAWDGILKVSGSDRQLVVVYDERSPFCVYLLSILKTLDVRTTIDFYSQIDAPRRYRDEEPVGSEPILHVFGGGERYSGYFALRELLNQHKLFGWLVWMMSLPRIEAIGARVFPFPNEE